jgi:hypothetical protein
VKDRPRGNDRDVAFHKKWLGLVQPIDGLMFSVPVLSDAQIAPEVSPTLSSAFEAQLIGLPGAPRFLDLQGFFREFLGYDAPEMLVGRDALPSGLRFYAEEGGQELRPSFALRRGPFGAGRDDPFAAFGPAGPGPSTELSDGPAPVPSVRFFALVWDLTETSPDLDLDRPESTTGPWRYPPTAKLERLLRHSGIPIGFLSNGQNLRLVYAPAGETTAHLTFRLRELCQVDGRPVLAALELLLHARRAYTAAPEYTLEGLLLESRRRQADVTLKLAEQVFEAVEILVAGFEAAATRDTAGGGLDWLRSALEFEDDHFYQGVISVVLRLVFLLYAEEQGLLPVDHPTYARDLSLLSLADRLAADAGVHPESMHHRFGAYGQLLALFRAVFYGVRHGNLDLPPRQGKLFDPNVSPFLEGGQPDWTAAVNPPVARSAVRPPSIDDGTVHRVLRRLMVFDGQRLSYRTLDVEQIGSVYESLMGFHVRRLTSPGVRMGKHGVWVEAEDLPATAADRARFFKDVCGFTPAQVSALGQDLGAATDANEVLEVLSARSVGRRADLVRHRAPAGRLVLQPGEERRRTGSHYTPRALTEKVVRRTVEPILACLGPSPTADMVLQLKICDPAMGSGAFLVAACRQLADAVVQAWTRSGELAAMTERHGDAHLHARRLVAQRCLYGVDKNAAAVELAKLSLWLVTLSRQLPFTFVDHALRHGDSLVGLDFAQIRAFHWKPTKQVGFCERALADALEQAIGLRQRILALAENEDPPAQIEKRRLLEWSRQAVDAVRLIADVCVGAFFAETKDAAREKERLRRLALVERWLGGEEAVRLELEDLAVEIRKQLPPFHWWIELPEVFFEERADPLQDGAVNGAALVEAVVGNPPFLRGKSISTVYGDAYLDWLGTEYPGNKSADLCAYFFRRAADLVGQHGAWGLVATNTIAQGDTRITGLRTLLSVGWVIYDATDSVPWPGDAAVSVSLVHGALGNVTTKALVRLGGTVVQVVNSRLRPRPERSDPMPLRANSDASFQGSNVLGMGFTLQKLERDELLLNPENADRIAPFLGGEEVNTDPGQSFSRYVIDFGRLSLKEVERWPQLLKIVRERVLPERCSLKRAQYREAWWQFAEPQTKMRESIASLRRCLVTSQVSKHLLFAFQPTDRVFSHALYVFPLDAFTAFAILQSRVHEPWARLLSSSMKTDLRYAASDCFETFPFPQPDPRAVISVLEAVGERLYAARAAYMLEANQGLTKVYNALKDPACDDARVLALRRRHEEMDRAVLDAYGWTDLALPPFCLTSDAERAVLREFEDEVIDRLYVLNAGRAREEKRLGPPASTKRRTRPKRSPGGKPPDSQGDLF